MSTIPDNTPQSTMTDNDSIDQKLSFAQDFLRRIRQTRLTRRIRFGIVSLVFLLWVVWMGNPWLSLGELLLFDIYITGYIPFTWWKKSKSQTVRYVMGWVDAIVYALVLVYFIFAFVGQNYAIPSSSLEKTLLTGDYLWVNKMVYGPRVPMTPVYFPLVHNKLPFTDAKSYLDNPSLSYHRLKGLRSVEAGDIAVFNFPAGDTVATKYEESPEYYELLVEKYGRERLRSDKATFGDIIYRPVDRRVNFVKRVVGLPGQRLRIVSDTIYIDGKAQPMPENVQFNYIINLSEPLTDELIDALDITPSDVAMLPHNDETQMMLQPLGIAPDGFTYALPLTAKMSETLRSRGTLRALVKMSDFWNLGTGSMYPRGLADSWTMSDWGGETGVLIPKKGMTVRLTPEAWNLYHRCIRNYENHPEAYFADGQAYINGKPADTYTFAMDYYFMMGDNRHNSQDSRFWGFVPEDHIVGVPIFVLASFDRERPLFDGYIRWNRFFRDANPDK